MVLPIRAAPVPLHMAQRRLAAVILEPAAIPVAAEVAAAVSLAVALPEVAEEDSPAAEVAVAVPAEVAAVEQREDNRKRRFNDLLFSPLIL